MRTILCIPLFVVIFSLISYGQSENRTGLYVGGGIAFPSEPQGFSDSWKMGYTFGGGFDVALTPTTSLLFSIWNSSFPLDEAKIRSMIAASSDVSVSISGGSASGLDISGGIKVFFYSTFKTLMPYATASIGYSKFKMSDVLITYTIYGYSYTMTLENNSESAVSSSFGLGLEIYIGETSSFFIEGRYLIAFTKEKNTIYLPVRSGIRIGF